MERFQSRPSPAVLVMSCRSINFVSTWSGRLAALNMLDMSEGVTHSQGLGTLLDRDVRYVIRVYTADRGVDMARYGSYRTVT